VPLEPGRYTATISALTIRDARREVFEFTVTQDEIVEHQVDFSSGDLFVGVQHNGELGDAVIRITNDAGKQVAASRSYTETKTNPKGFRLRPGAYRVNVSSVEIKGKPEKTFDVVLEAGKKVELEHRFKSGQIDIEVASGEALEDAVVTVRRRGERQELAKRRSRANARNNPVSFVLEPGDYDIAVKQLQAERGQRQLTLTVTAGETISRRVDFGACLLYTSPSPRD